MLHETTSLGRPVGRLGIYGPKYDWSLALSAAGKFPSNSLVETFEGGEWDEERGEEEEVCG